MAERFFSMSIAIDESLTVLIWWRMFAKWTAESRVQVLHCLNEYCVDLFDSEAGLCLINKLDSFQMELILLAMVVSFFCYSIYLLSIHV